MSVPWLLCRLRSPLLPSVAYNTVFKIYISHSIFTLVLVNRVYHIVEGTNSCSAVKPQTNNQVRLVVNDTASVHAGSDPLGIVSRLLIINRMFVVGCLVNGGAYVQVAWFNRPAMITTIHKLLSFSFQELEPYISVLHLDKDELL